MWLAAPAFLAFTLRYGSTLYLVMRDGDVDSEGKIWLVQSVRIPVS